MENAELQQKMKPARPPAQAKPLPDMDTAQARPCTQTEMPGASLDSLVTALQAYRRQQAKCAAPGERFLRGVGLALLAGPADLGVQFRPSPPGDEARATLSEAGPEDMPEARVCHLWLLCAAGEAVAEAGRQWVLLAQESLWGPVQALALRALAHYGQRRALAKLLPQDGPLSLFQADAWLEAAHAAAITTTWPERLTVTEYNVLPSLVCEQWRELIAAEAALACGELTNAVAATLGSLASLADGSATTYAEAQTQRIGARALAALARGYIGHGRECESLLCSGAGDRLPQWEHAYLRALSVWQLQDETGVTENLGEALAHNPCQTSIRLAWASWQSAQTPELALATLATDEPTREVLTARAALLVRLGRHAEAQEALEDSGEVGGEPARFSWQRGREQTRRQEHGLRAALAEKAGAWARAEKSWRGAYAESQDPTLLAARGLFVAHRELQSLSASQKWRRDLAARKWEHLARELGPARLTGDALFLHAVTLPDETPHQARREFLALLRQRSWVEQEQRAGGGRLIWLGDALWRLGDLETAARAYQLAPDPKAAERLAVLSVCAELKRGAEADVIRETADRAVALAPVSPWPHLLVALGLLAANALEPARLSLATAEGHGAPAEVCRVLRAFCATGAGAALPINEDLPLPPEITAVLQFLSDDGPESARWETCIAALGARWRELCPADPQLVAGFLLAYWCDEGKWDKARQYAGELANVNEEWATELAALVEVRYALALALRGELETAARQLAELVTALK